MTARELYALGGTVACATFTLAGLAMPLSDFALFTQHYDAARQLEAAGAACMVVGILAMCFWFSALRHVKSGKPPSMPYHSRVIALVLFCFGLAVSIATDVFPSTKQALQFALHCSPLGMCYVVWSMWKANDAAMM